MPTHSITMMYQTPSGALTGVTQVTSDTEVNADVTLAGSSTDIELDVALVRAKVQCLVLFCTAACTVETNSSTHSGGDLVTLVANQPMICANTAAVAVLLPTADVTKLYLTCAAGGVFSLRAIIDSTP